MVQYLQVKLQQVRGGLARFLLLIVEQVLPGIVRCRVGSFADQVGQKKSETAPRLEPGDETAHFLQLILAQKAKSNQRSNKTRDV